MCANTWTNPRLFPGSSTYAILTGRDISSGTFRIDDVQRVFVAAARSLEAMAEARFSNNTPVNYLTGLFGVDPSQVWRRQYAPQYQDQYITVLQQSGECDVSPWLLGWFYNDTRHAQPS